MVPILVSKGRATAVSEVQPLSVKFPPTPVPIVTKDGVFSVTRPVLFKQEIAPAPVVVREGRLMEVRLVSVLKERPAQEVSNGKLTDVSATLLQLIRPDVTAMLVSSGNDKLVNPLQVLIVKLLVIVTKDGKLKASPVPATLLQVNVAKVLRLLRFTEFRLVLLMVIWLVLVTRFGIDIVVREVQPVTINGPHVINAGKL